MRVRTDETTSGKAGLYRMRTGVVLALCAAILSGCAGAGNQAIQKEDAGWDVHYDRPEAVRDTVEGKWISSDSENDPCQYIYRLDQPIDRCESFSIQYDVEIVEGVQCDDWGVSIRSYGQWQEVSRLRLIDNSVTRTISLDSPVYMDAVAVYPYSDGELQWNERIEIFDAVQASEKISSEPPAAEAADCWLEGDYTDEKYEVNHASISVLQLRTPIRECRRLKLAVSIDMLYNTQCYDWSLYTKDGYNWVKVGDFYLPGGTGETETVLELREPMYIEYLAVVPKVNGSYSWACGFAVCDKS